MKCSPELLAWRASGHYVDFRGLPVFYREHPSRPLPTDGKPTLLLIHGFPTASWDWQALWPQLSEHFHLIAPDLLGLGFSAKPSPHDYSIMEQADMIEALMRDRGIASVHVLAHDYGDTVAQELLARADQAARSNSLRLETVTLLNGGLFPETHRARLIQRLLLTPAGGLIARLNGRAAFGRSFSAVFGHHTQPTARELDDFWFLIDHDGGRRVLHRLQTYIHERREHRARWVGALQTTSTPLQLINGSVDPVSGAHMVARYRELVPQTAIVELPTIGHYPNVESPGEVLAALLAFIERRR